MSRTPEIEEVEEYVIEDEVILTIKGKFNNEVHKIAYSFDGGRTWQKDASKTISENGTIRMMIRDAKLLTSVC